MPKFNRDGKAIFSAGEVGSYVVCPESWRLANLQGSPIIVHPHAEQGERLHQEWAASSYEGIRLSGGIRLVLLLLALGLTLYIFSQGWR